MNQTCQHCGEPKRRHFKEPLKRFRERLYCSLPCYYAAVAARHEDALWLIHNGTTAAEALQRCGLTAAGAQRWAIRHNRRDLYDAIRPAYLAEQTAWRRRRKAYA